VSCSNWAIDVPQFHAIRIERSTNVQCFVHFQAVRRNCPRNFPGWRLILLSPCFSMPMASGATLCFEMPELPEVETTRLGLAPQVEGRLITGVTLRRPDLRWPIPREIGQILPGQRVFGLRRRAKYMLLDLAPGSALLHLGMSGCLRLVPAAHPAGRHDHVDIALDSGQVVRFY
jgi:hypothetical protein